MIGKINAILKALLNINIDLIFAKHHSIGLNDAKVRLDMEVVLT